MQPRWVLGFLLVMFGSFADFAALSFGPQSLVAPLGSLTLVSNSIFAPFLLHEACIDAAAAAQAAILTRPLTCIWLCCLVGNDAAPYDGYYDHYCGLHHRCVLRVARRPHFQVLRTPPPFSFLTFTPTHSLRRFDLRVLLCVSNEQLFEFFWKVPFVLYSVSLAILCLCALLFVKRLEAMEQEHEKWLSPRAIQEAASDVLSDGSAREVGSPLLAEHERWKAWHRFVYPAISGASQSLPPSPRHPPFASPLIIASC
jgi:hypothetical protein